MKLHHIGFVVKNISTFQRGLLAYEKIKEVFDPVQNANLAIFSGQSDVMIELIQPLNDKSFTWNYLSKYPNPFHHLCYQLNTLDEMNEFVANYRLIHILGPVPALLFEMKVVYFYFDRNKMIVEFLIDDNK